ncbi:MAG: sulfite oxidase-like oxidoreductase [Solirubrobacteraceae bacterium]
MITPKIFGDRGRRRAEKLGIDPARLPPGQSPTVKFPVFTYKSVPEAAEAPLTIHGEVEASYTLSDAEFRALPRVEQVSDFHCVTRWSQFDMRFGGVRARDLIERARPRPGATHVLAHGLDGYSTNLPLEVVLADDVLIADSFDGAPLTPEHGFPRRLLVPARYGWKSAKWLRAIELLDHDEPGFWERNGYHNDGDPWREERHGSWR